MFYQLNVMKKLSCPTTLCKTAVILMFIDLTAFQCVPVQCFRLSLGGTAASYTELPSCCEALTSGFWFSPSYQTETSWL